MDQESQRPEAETVEQQKESAPAPKRKRRFGDRPDGYRLRSLQPMSKVSPYIMPDRSGASVYFHDSFEVTEVENYIRKKRNQGLKGFGVMHVLIASYVRIISQRPAVNRFLSGQRVYSHGDDIVINLTIKREMTLEAEETIIKMHFTPTATADDVYWKITKLIEENRQTNPDSDFDSTAKIFNYIPGLLLKNAVWFLKLLDYFGLLPKSLIEISPFHGSMFIPRWVPWVSRRCIIICTISATFPCSSPSARSTNETSSRTTARSYSTSISITRSSATSASATDSIWLPVSS